MLIALYIISFTAYTQKSLSQKSFRVIPLGVRGGADESNLSSYLVSDMHSENYISLDAGTLNSGLKIAFSKHLIKVRPAIFLKKNIKGYLISHAHLDHIAGMILNSPDDSSKYIYAMPYVIDILKDKYFTWRGWANFANEGDKPTLNKYTYVPFKEGEEIFLNNTNLHAQGFSLSHANPYLSSAFLIRNNQDYLLYLGDTGADSIERSDKLQQLWHFITPIINSGHLKGIFIECSFPDAQATKQLFGHLTPYWLMLELSKLNIMTMEKCLMKVNILITHIKPTGDNVSIIQKQIDSHNTLGLKIKYPVQGAMIIL